MATNIPTSATSTIRADETLSTDGTDNIIQSDYDLTNFLFFLFPLYIFAILFNFLAIYSILIARIYRQYLSNVLLAVICIGSLLNIHGQMFLVLQRWSTNSSSKQLCSSSYYLRDSGSILIHTHIFLLALERILANLKKHPTNLNKNLLQKAHFFLIIISFITIILSLTVPIYTIKYSSFLSFNGLCIPSNAISYGRYLNWIYYGFGHPLLWLSFVCLLVFLSLKATISYTTLIPMNRIISVISFFSCINILIQTLFDDIVGMGDKQLLNTDVNPSVKMFYLMNLRDLISMIHKIIIGLAFFLFRPEIRQWFMESMVAFRASKKEVVVPQMLEIRNESEENYDEVNDGNLPFRADI